MLMSVHKRSQGRAALPKMGGHFINTWLIMWDHSKNKPAFTGSCLATEVFIVITLRLGISRISRFFSGFSKEPHMRTAASTLTCCFSHQSPLSWLTPVVIKPTSRRPTLKSSKVTDHRATCVIKAGFKSETEIWHKTWTSFKTDSKNWNSRVTKKLTSNATSLTEKSPLELLWTHAYE